MSVLRILRAAALAAAFSLSAGAAAGQPPGAPAAAEVFDRDVPLSTYLRFAAEHNPALQRLYAEWMAAVEQIAVARGWPDPRLSYTNYLASVETALGPQQHAIALSQAIPWFGKLSLKGDAQERAALAAEQRFRQARLDLYARTARAYYEYAYLAQAEAVTRENLELMRFQEGVARARYRTESARYSDLVKAQVELGVLEDRLRTLQAQRSALAAGLNAALGRPADALLPWPVPLVEAGIDFGDTTTLRDRLRRNSPALRAAELERDRRERLEALARRNLYPDFMLGVKTVLTDPSELTSFEDRGRDAWMGTISLNLPIWRGKLNAAIRAAEARQRAAEHGVRSLEQALDARLSSVLFALEDAARKIRLYDRNLLPKAEQSLGAADTAYRAGHASFLDVIDAERTLLRFQLDLARARADHGEHAFEMSALLGSAPIDVPLPGEDPDANGSAPVDPAAQGDPR